MVKEPGGECEGDRGKIGTIQVYLKLKSDRSIMCLKIKVKSQYRLKQEIYKII